MDFLLKTDGFYAKDDDSSAALARKYPFSQGGTGIRQMMDFVFKMMDFVFKMMDFVFKMMDFVFKMMDLLFK